MSALEEIKQILGTVLGLGDRVNTLEEGTALLGSIPEFDSMAVVTVLTAIEDQYGIMVEDDDVSAETFETVGSLVQFVENALA